MRRIVTVPRPKKPTRLVLAPAIPKSQGRQMVRPKMGVSNMEYLLPQGSGKPRIDRTLPRDTFEGIQGEDYIAWLETEAIGWAEKRARKRLAAACRCTGKCECGG
jgi:hypothetical protein